MKKKNKILIYIISTLVLIGLVLFVLVQYDVISFGRKSNLQLATTNVNTKIKEGIYITDVSEVVEETMPAIVSITSKTLIQSGYFGSFSFKEPKQEYAEGAGSGIIINNNKKDILILTNHHVVDGSEELTVQFIDGEEADAKILGTSERKDVAVIAVDVNKIKKETLEKIKIATIGDSNKLKVGNGVIAIGNALGYGQSVTTGVVSALNRKIETDSYSSKMIQIDAAINGGNSGGALLNNKGEVVGINTAKYSSSGLSSKASIEGMGFAIPITDLKELITDLMNGKEESDGIFLGVEGYMTNNSQLEGYKFPVGFYIAGIKEGSYADKAKLEIGYIITKIDKTEVTNVNDIGNVLYDKKKGDTVTLTFKYPSNREYKEKEIKIKFD